MNDLVDFHTHILPGIDDGASDAALSNRMLQSLTRQGVGTVCLTPHFYSDRVAMGDFVTKRNAAYRLLTSQLQHPAPELVLGAEVYFSPVLLNDPDLSPVALGGGDYILLEMPYQTTFSNRTMDRLYQLMNESGKLFVFAHIDRYAPLMKNTGLLEELLDWGCLAQINLSALDDGFFARQKLLKLLDSGRIFALGTDCHNMTGRPPDYTAPLRLIEKKLGADFIARMMQNIRKTLRIN